MKNIERIQIVLEKVIFEHIPFNLAIKSSLKKEKKPVDGSTISLLTSVCGGYLRHYYSLNNVVSKTYPSLDEKQQILVAVLLSDILFSKKLDIEDSKKYVVKQCPDIKLDELFEKYSEPTALISSEIPMGSDEFIHLRYNLPLWLVKMWRKNCGHTLSKKLFKNLSKKDKQVVRIDNNKISDEEFFKKYPEFVPSDILDLAVIKETINPKKLKPVVEEDALNIHAGYKYAFEDIDLDLLRGLAIYGGGPNDVLDEIYARINTRIKADYICGNQKHFFEVNNKVKKYGITDLSVYECSFEAIRTCISKPVHTLIVSPENSCFQRLNEESDYFLNIKQEDLDGFIKIQQTVMNDAASLVEDGGTLIYIVPTICRNETYGLIHSFTNNHKEFSLEKEVQLFPFDKYRSMLYFAVLKKEIRHD